MTEERGPVGILACEHLCESLGGVLAHEEFAGVPVRRFPCHCHPPDEWQALFDDSIEQIASEADRIILLTCQCPFPVPVPGTLQDRVVIPEKQGGALFIPDLEYGSLVREGAFIAIPPFHPEDGKCTVYRYLRTMAPEDSPSRVVVPDTGEHAGIAVEVERLSRLLGRPVETLFTGTEHAHLTLAALVRGVECERLREICDTVRVEAGRRQADLAMVSDLLATMAGIRTEEGVIESIRELFVLLFSPGRLHYLAIHTDEGSDLPAECPGDLREGCRAVLEGGTGVRTEDGLILPVTYMDRLVGIIAMEDFAVPAYTDRYQNFLRIILPVCGLAVCNARHLQRLNETIEMRDEEIRRRKTAEEALTTANRKLNILSGVTRHDILNYIMVAEFYIEELEEEVPEEYREQVSRIVKSVRDIQRQIEFTRDYQDLGASAPAWQDVRSMVERSVKAAPPPDGVAVEIDISGVQVFADPLFSRAVHNIVTNAYQHAAGLTRLSISSRQADGDLEIIFADDGAGVAPEKKEGLFAHKPGKKHGYGLFLVREILAITNIGIRETGTPGEGARFVLTVPPGAWRMGDRD